jgi:hypothetical protein
MLNETIELVDLMEVDAQVVTNFQEMLEMPGKGHNGQTIRNTG